MGIQQLANIRRVFRPSSDVFLYVIAAKVRDFLVMSDEVAACVIGPQWLEELLQGTAVGQGAVPN